MGIIVYNWEYRIESGIGDQRAQMAEFGLFGGPTATRQRNSGATLAHVGLFLAFAGELVLWVQLKQRRF